MSADNLKSLIVFALIWFFVAVSIQSVLIGFAAATGAYALARLGGWYFKKKVNEPRA